MITGAIKSQIDQIWNAFGPAAFPIRSKSSSRSRTYSFCAGWTICTHWRRTSPRG
jgi:hypothetical protein